ncbi:ABC transporter ATP-binding protein [Devosia rhizoryzae]|uniref:ABC transporter ATP-binding protein n=1 Tax=Devosia rhizoryzae TaxID=2774137 RepID=A0ABX7C7Z6_9HYPH|nr:ABC transporter ATP-binding protein [Devosia rhizoryzae]QQR38081.1 ABC transporter ATP-binding protein [Devosia rhizoryzae]
MPLLALENLSIAFPSRNGFHWAVEDVSFSLGKGEILGIVGESGSGKSVTCLSLVGLLGHGSQVSGTMRFDGQVHAIADLPRLSVDQRPSIGMIFQDPAASLNPVRTVGSQITEVLRFGRGMDRRAAQAEAAALLDRVGIREPEARLRSYPHQMSGGMNQRVMIAMALAGQHRLLVADEPTTALDVTIQAQICKLLRNLVRETGLSIIFISHDLDLVAQLCDRVAVMFGGHLLETQSASDIVVAPRHAYTKALLAAIPGHQPARSRLGVITDEMRSSFLDQGEAA